PLTVYSRSGLRPCTLSLCWRRFRSAAHLSDTLQPTPMRVSTESDPPADDGTRRGSRPYGFMRSCLSGKALRFCYESRVLPHDPPFSTTERETIGADRQPVAPKRQLTGRLLRPQAVLFTIEAQVSVTVAGGDGSGVASGT